MFFHKMYFKNIPHHRISKKPIGKVKIITHSGTVASGYKVGDIVDFYGFSDIDMLVIKPKKDSGWPHKYLVLFDFEYEIVSIYHALVIKMMRRWA